MSPFARKYAEVVAVTLVASLIAAVAGVWLVGQYRSQNGLSGPEITAMLALAFGLLNQLGIWRNGSMVRDVHREVNGVAGERHTESSGRFDTQDKQLDRIEESQQEERNKK